MVLFYMTMNVIGELALTTLIWAVIIFFLITACCFLSFWKGFFCEFLERKKECALKYQTVDSYFTLMGRDLDDEETAFLEERAKDLSRERNMLVKDEDCFHESVLRSVYLEWVNKESSTTC